MSQNQSLIPERIDYNYKKCLKNGVRGTDMVGRRKFNKPIGRAKGKAIFWLTEIGAEWYCNSCKSKMPKGIAVQTGVCLEKMKTAYVPVFDEKKRLYTYKGQGYNNSSDVKTVARLERQNEYVKVFICPACAKEMLTELIEIIEQIEHTSLEAYRTFEEI